VGRRRERVGAEARRRGGAEGGARREERGRSWFALLVGGTERQRVSARCLAAQQYLTSAFSPHTRILAHTHTRSVALTLSLHNYRAFLKSHGWSEPIPGSHEDGPAGTRLTLKGHTLAGLFAGWSK
jgi:hypothetical protein